ncbi:MULTISPECIES: DEAD/DEAH box helicase [unclassified Arcicella]|uniref:DEAD/DEAH box helicase n=1 Tax=unclassified Arcicella TaxID=2644986 RepID=UPI00285E6728|nr:MULTISPECIES: DEAD/DEAH box helicase [unclassified Arcicella]MDR6564982.1 SNF2 family DNA or RNA helicase [Arcicella sp. BE51]MDR6814795.1 SNF2 family DNA or RNA helicase [Arcicella sp. BE140]MDR6826241.1 SNF2 family DNA or RNA helicase [Arcicella sp. BE139]
MKVSTSQPFQIIYSILNHEYLGYLFEAFVVQLDDKQELTLLNQNVSIKNINEFAHGLDENDLQLVKLIDYLQSENIYKKFVGSKKRTVVDFFLKVYDQQKGEKALQEIIASYVEKIKAEMLPLLLGKQLFIMGGDGNPIWQKVEVLPEKATVFFHFMRNEENTHYYPTIKYEGEKIDFQYKNAYIVCDEPAWMILENKLYHFAKEVDGKKLRPFLKKKFIVIPKTIEEDYYRKFVTSIISMFDVRPKGFKILNEKYAVIPILNLAEQKSHQTVLVEANDVDVQKEEDVTLAISLSFQYGKFTFRFDSFSTEVNVSMEKNGDDYVFHKVERNLTFEKATLAKLEALGLELKNGRMILPKSDALALIQKNYAELTATGFTIEQSVEEDAKKYFLGYSNIEVNITEGNDWFDIHAIVHFGDFEIPFLKLRNLILQKKREFTLPNGEIAVIPETWFTQYSELFAFIEHHSERDGFILNKHHLSLVQDLQSESLASAVLSRKLEKLRDFEEMQTYQLPKGFTGSLRPYQKAGYDWMRFLNDYHFGGCLADDMGLGKTVQTLTLLQSQKEQKNNQPSLLILPTSLIYNWEMEARKFTPELRILTYTGTYRDKNIEVFDNYDVVLTTYGIIRIDIDLLKNYRFNYVILDESQAIKNPSSYITKAVMQLNSRNRLVLTGTPLENSTMDLWSQMTFINPGLLGSQHFFRNEFQVPIEKKGDDVKMQRLYSIIKPFMLRRHKSQVATELPPKIESIHYAQMTEQQQKEYEEAKSYFRNLILEHIEEAGMAMSQMVVLQGLTKLRQLANHPRMTEPDYQGDSGKLEDVMEKLDTILEEGHKVLIFSQFVKHLDLFKERLDQESRTYAYLDGSTHDRQAQVEKFQNNEDIQIFLISLKAGGLGLNLTAADYVFILDPWWNPAIEAQAIDRAHRIGQINTVFTYKFITKNTVEEKILALQQSKQRLANELITTEESFVKSLTKDDVLALLE